LGRRIFSILLGIPVFGRFIEHCISVYEGNIGWKTVDRKTSKLGREQQTFRQKLTLLLIFNPLTEWFDRTKVFRSYLHKRTDLAEQKKEDPRSRSQIASFVRYFKINMKDFEPTDISEYQSFQEFFIRKHAVNSRPIAEMNNAEIAVSCADARLVVYESVDKCKRLWIKGHGFTIENLLQDKNQSTIWNNGAIACFRLSPQDYHRYHSPVNGKTTSYKQLGGDYYGVDPLAISSSLDVLAMNNRVCIGIESPEFGKVMFVAIGAEDVGKIRINEKFKTAGTEMRKGDEIGLFEFGGSSIIILFEKGRIRWDNDLVRWSDHRIMIDVEVGMRIGCTKV